MPEDPPDALEDPLKKCWARQGSACYACCANVAWPGQLGVCLEGCGPQPTPDEPRPFGCSVGAIGAG